MPNIITTANRVANETTTWKNAVIAAGGGFEWNSVAIANNFVRRLKAKTYSGKIKYLLPMLGANINAARVPLIDVLRVGTATNTSFVNSDFSQSTGLQANGGTKYFDTLIKFADLGGGTNFAGVGYWARTIGSVGGWCARGGVTGGDQYGFYLNNTPRELFYYGDAAGRVDLAVSASVGCYYSQKSAALLREIYQNGVLIGNNTSSSSDSNSNVSNILLLSDGGAGGTDGQCSLMYLTDGSMTSSEIFDFHGILQNYLISPTGK